MTDAAERTLSMRFVQALVHVVERAGVPRRAILRALRIDAAQLTVADARVPASELHRMFEHAIELTGDPALGLRWVTGLNAPAFAPLTYLVAHAGSLRQGLDTLSSFQRLVLDGSCFELVEHDGKASVRCGSIPDAPLHVRRLASEMMVSCFWLLLRSGGARPERACFEHAAPPYRKHYTRIFKRAERFGQPWSGVVFDGALLDRPWPHGDEDMQAALRALAERRVLRLTQRAAYAQRVRDFLVGQGRPRRVDMQTVARALELSARSLRRRLASERRSYKDIENEALAIVAKRLLLDERRTIQETAYEMGFSDTTAFHRAFKRWTGTTPSAYRDRT